MMHRIIRDHLEQVLGQYPPASDHPAGKHLAECEECREAVAGMREQAAMLRQWRTPAVEMEPRPGFYARVLERIEAQTPSSAFFLFFDSLFGRRIAMASLALALLLGVYVISSEQMAEPEVAGAGALPQVTLVSDMSQDLPSVLYEDPQPRLVTSAPDQDAVLVNLVTYREQ
jgi:predicted anti-sigma-YlaC factor YlaD